MQKILVTGSEGRIGRQLSEGLQQDYEIIDYDQVQGQDAADYKQLRGAAQGVFAIIHTAFNLADERSTTGYEGDPRNFAMGRFAIKVAAEVGARHCIMASSVNAGRDQNDGNWHYRETKQDLERLASTYAQEVDGTSYTSIRYGCVKNVDIPPEAPLRTNQSWISAHDNVALVKAILESDPQNEHTVVYGVSNRPDSPFDLINPFGWQPKDWFGQASLHLTELI